MKKIFIAILSLTGFIGFAQQKSFGDKFSFELGYGYTMPMGEIDNGEISDYADFKNLALGFQYNVTDNLGVKIGYNFSEFQNKEVDYLGSTYHRFTVGASYDVYGAFYDIENPFKNRKRFDGLVNAGLGVAFSQPDHDKSITDKGLTFHVGVQPKYNITDQLSIFLDVSYVTNLQRDYGIDGMTYLDGGSTSYVNANLGLSYRFGDN